MAGTKEKLPRETEDNIIEVSLKHVVFTFGGLAFSALTVSAGVIFIRDYAKFRRQKAILDLAKQLLTTLQDGGDSKVWKKTKTASLSSTKT